MKISQQFKQIIFQTTCAETISTKLAMYHSWVKGETIQIFDRPLSRGDKSEKENKLRTSKNNFVYSNRASFNKSLAQSIIFGREF